MKKIIVGGSGFLGRYLIDAMDSDVIATFNSNTAESVTGINWLPLDLTNLDAIKQFCEDIQSDQSATQIYFLAACHHPDFVEDNSQQAWEINIIALAKFLNHLGPEADLIYVSTDNVYGESDRFHAFSEQDKCSPANEYGRQKLLAEQLVLKKGFKVARCSFLIGPSKADKKHFFDFIADTIKSGKQIDLLSDSYRSSISFKQTAELLIELMDKYYQQEIGVVNIGTDDVLSKFDVGIKIAKMLQLDTSMIKDITMNDQEFFKAKRPKNILLDNTKLKRLLNISHITLEF